MYFSRLYDPCDFDVRHAAECQEVTLKHFALRMNHTFAGPGRQSFKSSRGHYFVYSGVVLAQKAPNLVGDDDDDDKIS